jgi:hypothetical protein
MDSQHLSPAVVQLNRATARDLGERTDGDVVLLSGDDDRGKALLESVYDRGQPLAPAIGG